MYEMTKEAEGCRFVAYPDPGTGNLPWTIGYGHTKGVKKGDTCTQAQADAWLSEDMAEAGTGVTKDVRVALTPPMREALTDFVFNLGASRLAGSTLLKKLNAGDYEGAAMQFRVWNLSGGEVMAGLVRRRAAEEALFRQDSFPIEASHGV